MCAIYVCSYNMYTNIITEHDIVRIDDETSKKKSRPRLTWPPSTKRRFLYHAPTTPTMTWYYSAGRPLPVLPSTLTASSYDEITNDTDDKYHLMLDRCDINGVSVVTQCNQCYVQLL